jgi:hypothetical protein
MAQCAGAQVAAAASVLLPPAGTQFLTRLPDFHQAWRPIQRLDSAMQLRRKV